MSKSKVNQERLKKANERSDHNAQISLKTKTVSQNIQGPYSIKRGAKGNWIFDLPKFNPTSDDLKNLLGPQMEPHIDSLLEIMKTGGKKKEVINKLKALKVGIGEELGELGYRLTIEPDAQYLRRVSTQMDDLIGSIEGGPDVLYFQEQPYNSKKDTESNYKKDTERLTAFTKLMNDKGYAQVATLEERDVGIWVKKDNLDQYTNVTDRALRKMVEQPPMRGCLTQDKTTLHINIHSDRIGDHNVQMAYLIKLRQAALKYAKAQNPPLNVVIMGDFNLFRYTPSEAAILSNLGYTLEPAKGQENPVFKDKTYEVYDASYQDIHYGYQFSNRFHLPFLKASGKEELVGKSYGDYEGDRLKTAILHDFKRQLNACKDQAELETFKTTYKSTPEYKVLKTGQGLWTKTFSKETSSVKALKDMIQERENEIQQNEPDKKSESGPKM